MTRSSCCYWFYDNFNWANSRSANLKIIHYYCFLYFEISYFLFAAKRQSSRRYYLSCCRIQTMDCVTLVVVFSWRQKNLSISHYMYLSMNIPTYKSIKFVLINRKITLSLCFEPGMAVMISSFEAIIWISQLEGYM